MTCPELAPHSPHWHEPAQRPCPGNPVSPLGTLVADHVQVTAHPDQPLVCICVRNAEVLLTVDEWASLSMAGDLAALQIRTRAARTEVAS